MIQDTVDVQYPDGKTRKVRITVPLYRIRSAVIRNLKIRKEGTVFPQIYFSKAYQDDPFTMAEVFMDFNGTRIEGVGFSKRKASDRRHAGVGISIALYRAAWNAAAMGIVETE
jgi:hypothetical protein